MQPSDLTYVGPPIDDPAVLGPIPPDLRELLEAHNGFIAYRGGLHLRGATVAPTWHSLSYWWQSDDAIQRQFPAVQPSDIPFGQDVLGDQLLLRDGEVHRLVGESGDLQPLGMGLRGFLDACERDPSGFLGLAPLEQFLASGGVLEPGELLSVYPPFIAAESRRGISIRAISVAERISFLARLAKAVSDSDDGTPLRFDIVE